MANRSIEIKAGDKFGRLTVLGFSHKHEKYKTYVYKCICECGVEKLVSSTHLKNGDVTSCGCLKKETARKNGKQVKHEDLKGRVFGKLTVIELVKIDDSDKFIWKCICECGNITHYQKTPLKRGQVVSCGCYKKNRYIIHKHNNVFTENYGSFKKILNSYIYSAKKRNKNFNLTVEEFKNLIDSNCYYCGLPPSSTQKGTGFQADYIYNGIDRLDSLKGYETSNCVPCCKCCNTAKNSMKEDEFYEWIERLHSYQQNKKKHSN